MTVTKLTDAALLDILDRLWQMGDEEQGEDEETGLPVARRLAVLVAVRGAREEYPDVRTLLADMRETVEAMEAQRRPPLSVVQ